MSAGNTHYLLRIFVALIISIVFLPQHIYADKVPDSRENVHVGIILQPGIAMPTGTGIYYGFDVEYMYKISQYANLHAVYHVYDNNEMMFQALSNGEIQMALGISPTTERKQQFLFANTSFYNGNIDVRVHNDDTRFTFNKPEEFNDKIIGLVKASITHDCAKKWIAENNIHPVFRLYEDVNLLYADMDAGVLDAVISTGSKVSRDYRSAIHLSTNNYYPIFARDQVLLKEKVDEAMNIILYDDGLYPEKLFAKYSHFQIEEGLYLTSQEKAYIAEHPVLRVAILENQAPFSFIDDDGEPQGIAPELYRRISQTLDWPVEFKVYRYRDEIITALHSGEADVYALTTQDIIASEEAGLALSKSIFKLDIFSLKRPDVEKIYTAAYIGRMPNNVQHMMHDRLSDVNFKPYDTLEECYEAMMHREVDAVFCNMAQMNWLMVKKGSDKFVVGGLGDMFAECSSQMLSDNKVLNSIISKTVKSKAVDITSIINRNIYMKPSTMDYIHNIPTKLVVIFFMVILFITVMISRMMYISHQKQVSAELSAKQAALEASERARQAESNFLSTMSHDMRTPLNGILGYTRMAKGSTNMEEVQQYLENIDNSSKLMLALVNDVLDLSKLASGKMMLREEKIIPMELYNTIKSAITMNAETRHVEFKSEVRLPENMVLYSDRLRLQQIAMNLLSNAMKYTPAGGHVFWDVSIVEENGEYVLIELIKDDGIGMSEEFQEHMFEIFTQEIRNESLSTRGTGLGLSLVHNFINMFGGTISVKSKLNEGSEFTVRIPVKMVPEVDNENDSGDDSSQEYTKNISKDLLKDVPILLVEDNEINAELAQLMLSEYGANMIDWAENGAVSVELYSASEPSHYRLILMDLRMPILDGFAATRKIRALHRPDAAVVPIIAMSADAYEEDIQHCKDVGMQAHVSKPVDLDTLIRVIAEHL
ncbi:MAG: transporter substrate-binding domain-containing protein [Anaerovibrio sp.]|nr:transporter substrate-binding domain-containing protein [Anaerovibrio sp.]